MNDDVRWRTAPNRPAGAPDYDDDQSALPPYEDDDTLDPLPEPPRRVFAMAPVREARETEPEPEPENELDDPPSGNVQITRAPEPRRPAEPAEMRPLSSFVSAQGTERSKPDEDDLRITLWGGTGSGKTTFMAVLAMAAEQAYLDPKIGPWTMTPRDVQTEDFIREIRTKLTAQGRLPEATLVHNAGLSWTMRGPSDEPEQGRRSLRLRKPVKLPTPEFQLRMPDVPGEYFRPNGNGLTPEKRAALLNELANSHGIIYLFDPVTERKLHSSFEYLDGLLESLRRRTEELGGFVNGRLPHCLAVCTTKFDEPEVHDLAARAGLLREDPMGQPYVPAGEPSARLFGLLCKQLGGSAPLVQNSLRSNFAAKRVQFYTTSSIGFRLAEKFGIHPDDSYNLMLKDGTPVVRDSVRPIGVLEPVIGLERLISENRAR